MGEFKKALTAEQEVARLFLLGCFHGTAGSFGHDEAVIVIEAALAAFKKGEQDEPSKRK